jgi:oligoribonuclease NrnB/cAMP/cGMP phosphodiesterase (DHH superfamily)
MGYGQAVKRFCFYHAGCPDGFGAAWAVARAWGQDATYIPRGHDDPIDAERYARSFVVFADIATDNETLHVLGEEAEKLVVLDHHISALRRFEAEPALGQRLKARGHIIHFDLSHSGAMLAWHHFHPDVQPPDLLRYVEDQDLWRFALPDSLAVNAAIASYPRSFETWDELVRMPAEALAAEGAPIIRAQQAEIQYALRNAHPIRIQDLRLEAVNAVQLRSHLGHELALRAAFGAPCGAVYRLAGDRVDVSIYSIGEFDVSEIAAELGGGGHRNAAGFTVPLRAWIDHFVPDGSG